MDNLAIFGTWALRHDLVSCSITFTHNAHHIGTSNESMYRTKIFIEHLQAQVIEDKVGRGVVSTGAASSTSRSHTCCAQALPLSVDGKAHMSLG